MYECIFDCMRVCVIAFNQTFAFNFFPSLLIRSYPLAFSDITFFQLNDLRRQQSVIFIVATNRLRSFDAAVTRPGRFDFLLFVGTPNLLSREKRLESRLEGTRMLPAKRFFNLPEYSALPFLMWSVPFFVQFHSSPYTYMSAYIHMRVYQRFQSTFSSLHFTYLHLPSLTYTSLDNIYRLAERR